MFDLIERVVLLHELRELVGREEFADRCLERARVYKRDRRRRFGINHRHTVLDVALHAREADAHALLEEFSPRNARGGIQGGRCRPPRRWGSCIELRDVDDDADHVFERERGIDEIFLARRKSETAIEVEAADAREIVAIG